MISILGRVKIQDLPTFIGIFATRGAAMRQQHGSLDAQLFTVCDTPDTVVVMFDLEQSRGF